MRFESSGGSSHKNPGFSLISFTGEFWALSSVGQQIRLLEELINKKSRFHFTRLDVQLTTLNPTQSAEQICEDVAQGRLWIKGFRNYEQKGVRDINDKPTSGLSACFGAATSNRRAISYNKQAEQKNWPTPARRDEVNLLGDWGEAHTVKLAKAVIGAASETAAIEAFTANCSSTLAQHMQYLDLNGVARPRPKNWARGRKPPSWWREDLDQVVDPVTVTRKPQSDVEVRFEHMKTQWARTFAEYVTERVADRKATALSSPWSTPLCSSSHTQSERTWRSLSDGFRRSSGRTSGRLTRSPSQQPSTTPNSTSDNPSKRGKWDSRLLTGGPNSQRPPKTQFLSGRGGHDFGPKNPRF